MTKEWKRKVLFVSTGLLGLIGAAAVASAQDGNAGLNKANEMVRQYFNTGINLLYAIGGVMGCIGAVKVYRHLSKGDREAESHAASWLTGCIFLVVVAAVLHAFFGL